MLSWFRRATIVAVASISLVSAALAEDAKRHGSTEHHRLLIQVDQNDPALMNLALNNATNVIEYYRAKGEDVSVDVDENGRATRTMHHLLKVFLIDAHGEVREIYSLAFLQPSVMFNDIKTLALESGPAA